MKLTNKQIKQIEELTGFRHIKKPNKEIDFELFFSGEDDENKRCVSFEPEIIKIEKRGISFQSTMDKIVPGEIIPFKWLKPLGEILGGNNE